MPPYSVKPPVSALNFFFFNDRAPPEIYPLPLHDALPISAAAAAPAAEPLGGEARGGRERQRVAGRAKSVRPAAPGGGHPRRGDRRGQDPGARSERRLGEIGRAHV